MAKYGLKIHTLGCKVNQYDSATLLGRLLTHDFELVNDNAELVIVNTCAVTKTAIKKANQEIKKARILNPRCFLMVMGCWPKAYLEDSKEIDADLVWPVGDFEKLIKKLSTVFNFKNKNQDQSIPSISRSRYFIAVQDGCEQYCSYCIIPYTRGKLKSRKQSDIIREIKNVIDLGFKEVVLSGIHLGLYGHKRKNEDLYQLMLKLLTLKGLGRIRLSSIELNEVSDEIVKLIANNDKVCRHLHIPLQSGSDNILKRMNRPYSRDKFKQKIKKIRKLIPDISLTTDVIVGFPGETEKDFNETKELIKGLKFNRLHVFPFSEHEKTIAAKMKNKIKNEVKVKRAKELRSIGKTIAEKYCLGFKNKLLNVVIESIDKNSVKGKSEYYFDVNFKKEDIVKPIKINYQKKEIVQIKFKYYF